MFEKIHFIKNVITKPLKSSEDLQGYTNNESEEEDSSNILRKYNFLGKCDFCIDGENLFCAPHPLTEFAQKNLFFIQSFTLFKTGPLHFTRRQDTASYMILFTYSGHGYMEYKDQIWHLDPGDGILVDCREPHFYCTEGSYWEHSVLHFQGKMADYFYKEICKNGFFYFHQTVDGAYQKQLENLIEIYDGVFPSRELLISNRLENILVNILSHSEQFKDHMNKIPENFRYLIKYIDTQYTKPLSLDYLADFSGISKSHLCRIFKKYLGLSPTEYIIRLRIENAKQLLESTSLPANKIGVMVGIEDENYFYRLYKSRTGMPPNEWRTMKK